MRNIHKKRFMIIITFILVLFSTTAFAQTDPGGVFYPPPGTDVFLFYYKHIRGYETYVDGTQVSHDASMQLDLSMFRYAHYGKTGAFPWSVNVILPYGSMKLEKGVLDQTSTGLGDPVLVGTIWLLDLPQNNLYGEITCYVTAPLGEYRNDRAVNLGSNRWSFKPEIGIGWKPLNKLSLELLGSVEFFTDNDDASPAAATLKKDPLYGVWGHVTYNFTKSVFLAGSAFWFTGGENELNGTMKNDETQTTSGMITAGLMVAPNMQLLLQYKSDLDVKNGIAQDVIQTRLAYFF